MDDINSSLPTNPDDNLSLVMDPMLMEIAMHFQQIIMMYEAGIKEITTKLEILNDEFQVRRNRNPIESIKSRIKEPMSITEKLQRKGLPITVNSMMENINDIAGIRVTCSFISDIYEIANLLINQNDITLISKKDYIKKPKGNGYRSLHLVIKVPIFLSETIKDITVEIQIRTIAMDFWASLEHKLRYKKDYELSESISKELKECAMIIAETDLRMQNIAQELFSPVANNSTILD